jgi:pSer/pThr/pTyr-binding forkhead associated (FHA) protein
MAQQAVSSTTQALKGVTKQLSGASKRAPGKLVILQGANVGKEFRLATQMVKVGRDPQFCDFALYDEYASNPHFSIQMEQNKFFITDEGSTNGTRLNGRPLQPQQRVPLQPDAIIEVGQTRLQFKRLGGTTRQIGQRQPSAGAGGQAGAPQQQRGGPTKKVP